MEDLIIKINRKTRQVDLNNVSYIGNDHENLQENLIFQFEDEFVNGQARLEYEINGTKNYIILEKVEETYQIPVKNVITIYQEKTLGKIQIQLVITEGTDEEETPVFKSNIFYLRCRPSINAVTEAPEGYELWIERANAILNQMDTIDIDLEETTTEAEIIITRKDGTQKTATIPKSGGVTDHSELTSLDYESFNDNLLDYPVYTRPEEFRGMRVPEVLLSGHHKNIEEYRSQEQVRLTKENRNDLSEGGSYDQ